MIKRALHCHPHRARFLLAFLLASALWSAPSHAADIIFALEDEPIYTSSNTAAPGLLNELVNELMAQLKLSPKVMYLPWKRAQIMTINTPNTVIFPLTRTPEREANYRWILKVLDVPVMFISKEGTPLMLSSGDMTQSRGIGVILGTPQEAYLEAAGIPYVALTGETLYPALASGQLHAVYSAGPEAAYAWKVMGRSDRLIFGEPKQTLPLWIATNKASDQVIDSDWVKAFEQLRKSGELDAIVGKYFNTSTSTGH